MKRFAFLSLLLITITLMSQNQNVIDDIYFIPGKTDIQSAVKQSNVSKPNYKNGAKEIIYKERKINYPTLIKDTIYVDGKSPDGNTYHTSNQFNINNYDGHTNPVYLHDTIYLSGLAQENTDNIDQDGHYLNGFNGNESDKEYAERIRRFHNPKYSIFIGDPRYNDIYFLNNSDWNVYVDDSYAYVTPTWTNPYWWNYNFNSFGMGYGWNSNYYGYNGMYSPWGYNNFYGYGGMFGYNNFYDPYGYYGYGGYYGNYGYGYGAYLSGTSVKNKNFDDSNRRSTSNYNTGGDTRLGGTRTDAASSIVNSGGYNTSQSRNPYTIVSGTTVANTSNSRYTSNSTTRIVTNQANGIGLVRNTSNRGFNTSSANNTTNNLNSRTSTVNTQPRTYTSTSNSVPTGNYPNRNNNSTVSSFRSSNSSIIRSNTSSGTNSESSSRGNYSSGNTSSGITRSSNSSPSYSTPSSSTYTSGSSYSSGSSSGGSRSSSSSSGGRR